MTQHFKIAAIAGDGIGKEVLPEGLRVLDAAARRFGIDLAFTHIDWASCDHYAKTGAMMPPDWKAQLEGMDAIYFGAVGWPATVPDHVSLWGSLLKFRREFDQYINLRPVRLFDGVPCPLAGRKPGEIDFFVVRENTEGEYTNLGGVLFEGTEREVVIQESVFTRHGSDRVLKYAFELANARPRKKLTLATKSNGIAISMPWWDGRAGEMAKNYPAVAVDKQHIDILCARFVLQPDRFDVVVATNLFGDILSDLGPACTGTIGLAPSANLNPEPGGDDLVGRADARLPRPARGARQDREGDRASAQRGPAHARPRRQGEHQRNGRGDRGADLSAGYLVCKVRGIAPSLRRLPCPCVNSPVRVCTFRCSPRWTWAASSKANPARHASDRDRRSSMATTSKTRCPPGW
jgi:tartrate dehydrogenase/decarboxylase/D-malate dehydrogenase